MACRSAHNTLACYADRQFLTGLLAEHRQQLARASCRIPPSAAQVAVARKNGPVTRETADLSGDGAMSPRLRWDWEPEKSGRQLGKTEAVLLRVRGEIDARHRPAAAGCRTLVFLHHPSIHPTAIFLLVLLLACDI